MLCNQCEQTAKGTGCTSIGVCEKTEDIQSLQNIVLGGLKGIAAYAYHARELGARSEEADAMMHEALFTTGTNVNFDVNRLVALALRVGKANLAAMETLDKAHTQRFGIPTPTEVKTGTRPGPGILVTGHDILDLYEILRQTENTGINVYTHGELLPAHAYPELRKFKHLAGNYGGAWQKQKDEFSEFPGVVVATSNCVLVPKPAYQDRLITVGVAGVPGVAHIEGRDFKPLVAKAKTLPAVSESKGGSLFTGFHHTAVLGLAGKILELVKAGKIRHFFLVGGCDGTRSARSYYTDLVKAIPRDCVIITLACGKFRFNYLDLGDIDGIPRLIDMGQCNNAYSAIQVAAGLANALKVGLNDLPLSLVLSWYEQKAVAILLTLFHLGIKGIRIGPTAPAFITPNVLKVIQDAFDLKLITTPEQDLKVILG